MTEGPIPSQDAAPEPERPLGVWLLTIYYGLFAGLLPLVAVLLFFFGGEGQAAPGLSWLDLALSVSLSVGIMAAAVGAWRGSNRARIALVLLLILHYGLLVVNNFALSTMEGLDDSTRMSAVARGIRYLFHIGVNVWYFFLSERPKAFYQRAEARRPSGASVADPEDEEDGG